MHAAQPILCAWWHCWTRRAAWLRPVGSWRAGCHVYAHGSRRGTRQSESYAQWRELAHPWSLSSPLMAPGTECKGFSHVAWSYCNTSCSPWHAAYAFLYHSRPPHWQVPATADFSAPDWVSQLNPTLLGEKVDGDKRIFYPAELAVSEGIVKALKERGWNHNDQ